MKIKNIVNNLDDFFILYKQEKWDNSGLQLGSLDNEVNTVMICLDISEDAVNYAIEEHVDLIITHHPMIFSGIKKIDYNSYEGRIIRDLVKNDISVYSMHTNLDSALNGMSVEFAKKLNIDKFEVLHTLHEDENLVKFGYGGVSDIEPIMITDYSHKVKACLGCEKVKLYTNNTEKEIKRVAFCSGSGAEFIYDAIKFNADVYITGDIKYHDAQYALRNNLSIIDAGHFLTENIIVDKLYNYLKQYNIDLKKYDKNTVFEYYI